MSRFKLVINQKNLDNRNVLFENTFLNELTDIIIDNKKFRGTINFIRDMFYLKSIEEYDFALNRCLIGYANNFQIFLDVYNLFKEYKPYKKYDLGLLRGRFLELLSYKYLKRLYDKDVIYSESKIKINDYESHFWDIIIKLEDILKLYECKFSSKTIKRSHLNSMLSLKNKIHQSEIYLTTFEHKDIVMDDLNDLICDTSQIKFDNMLKTFNYIYLEDYTKENPFDN